MRRSRGWLAFCAVVVALAVSGVSVAQSATPAGGVGTLSLLSAGSVTAGRPTTVVFSYTAPTLAIARFQLLRTVTVTVPSSWTVTASATVTCPGGASACWINSQSRTQIVVEIPQSVTPTFTLDYPAMPPGSAGTFPFTATEALGAATPTSLPALTVNVTCPDGAGMMTTDPGSVTAGQSTNLTFTYTAGNCGAEAGGEVEVKVPGGWPTSGSVAGSGGSTPAMSGSMITVPTGDLGPYASLVFHYDMAQAPSSAGGYTFDVFEQSSTAGSLQALASSPEVMVTATVATSAPPASATSAPPVSATSAPPVPATSAPPVPATSAPPVPATSAPPVSATSAPPVSATSAPPVPASRSGTSSPVSAGRLPIELVGFGLGGLGLSSLVVAAVAARLVASRWRHRGGHGEGGGSVRAVPHTGPPPSVAVRDTGNRPTLSVRLEPRVYATMTTIKEQRP